MLMFYVALIPLCLTVYFLVVNFSSDAIFFNLVPQWMKFLILKFPGQFFVPSELSTASVIGLANILGDIVGVLAASLFASIATLLWVRLKVEKSS